MWRVVCNSGVMEDEEHLTAFERERAARIRSNFERLKQLGVVDAVQQIRPKHVKPVKGQQQGKKPKLKPWEKELPSTARRSSRLIGLKTQGPKISKTQGAQVHVSLCSEDSVLTRKASLVVYRKKVLELPRDLLGKLKYSSLEVKEKPSQQVCPTEDKSQSGRLRKPTSPAIKLRRYMADQDQRQAIFPLSSAVLHCIGPWSRIMLLKQKICESNFIWIMSCMILYLVHLQIFFWRCDPDRGHHAWCCCSLFMDSCTCSGCWSASQFTCIGHNDSVHLHWTKKILTVACINLLLFWGNEARFRHSPESMTWRFQRI